MINNIYNTPISFTGKTYSRKGLKECEKYCSKANKKIKKAVAENYMAYMRQSGVNLDKSPFGYKIPVGSLELKPYTGTLEKSAGFSTEAGGYGGGWIKANINTPLSTKDVHNCALLNLINDNTGEQLLYHVYAETQKDSIVNLIKREFPRFTRANIMPGDLHQTNTTVNNTLNAVADINPKAMREYYHMPVENPEVVAINGELRYIENKNPDKMTFTEVCNQYNY